MQLAAHTMTPAQNAQPNGSDNGLGDGDVMERSRGDATPTAAHNRYTMPRKMGESWTPQPPSIACVSGSIGSLDGSGMNTRRAAAAMAFDRAGRWKSTRSAPDAGASSNEWPTAPTRRVPAMDWFKRVNIRDECMASFLRRGRRRRRWGWRGRRGRPQYLAKYYFFKYTRAREPSKVQKGGSAFSGSRHRANSPQHATHATKQPQATCYHPPSHDLAVRQAQVQPDPDQFSVCFLCFSGF
ncbi:hypothetical protein BOTBODRAFT_622868 [Botryobasidium botryosum FD-172 SS1]|uniref:Uncharacterized protein n=1 Tax=Botryobasidium botryosum (strain FD-172 SS1) TaxID=930990 RepID=A0A067MNN4_BOTB1|nr:hypothetical protein BOTBODRAFT_622868 [Botryobasidium botryosum FD-172 SS1]